MAMWSLSSARQRTSISSTLAAQAARAAQAQTSSRSEMAVMQAERSFFIKELDMPHQPISPLLQTLSFDWIWNQVKVPKGFENFFPKGTTPKKSPLKDGTETSTDIPNQNENKQTNDDTTTNKTNTSGKSSSRRRRAGGNRQNRSPNDDDDMKSAGPLFGFLSTIAIFLFLRNEQDKGQTNGQEINWHDFRAHLIQDVEKIVIVNKVMARVYLKDGARGMPMDTSTLGSMHSEPSIEPGQLISEEWDDGTQITSEYGKPGVDREANQTSKRYHFYIGSVESLEEKLANAQNELGVQPRDLIPVQYIGETDYLSELIKISPVLLLLGLTTLAMRSAGGAGAGPGAGIFQVGKSNAKRINKEDINVTFADVAGCQEAKKEVMEFVDFLQDSSRFTKLGAKIPKGALLCGPPGTGKTLLAKAVAGEANVPFYSISGSDFLEMFVGVGPSRVRDLFKEARANAPCIIFIDEIDAVGRQRGRGGFSGGNDERENTLNQLLVEMDGFQPSTGVVVLAGTNRADILDQALLRPGRFDRQIQVDKPDLQGRKEIFEVHLKGITLAGPSEEFAGRLAGLTPGFAGADIANICNEAAIVAARRKGESVTFDDFERATDRIIGGLESNKIMSEEERSIVAYHEAGHAIAGWFLEHTDPVLKVTIIPRTSGALGYAQYLPKETFLRSHDQIMDVVCMALAGRAAEEVFFGSVTTGASDDLRRVTQMVYSTIKDYGMNSRVGQLSFPQNDSGWPADKPYSDATARAIDEEARSIVDAAYQRTVDLVRERREEVEKVALKLLEKETITHDEIVDLVGPRPYEGDAQYQDYVSNRRPVDREAQPEDVEEKKQEDASDGMLTPGLA